MNELSDYELIRLNNIKKNEEFLKTLQIESTKHSIRTELSDSLPLSLEPKKRKATTKKVNMVEEDDESKPVRRSTRGRSGPVDDANLLDEADGNGTVRARPQRPYVEKLVFDEENETGRVSVTADSLRNLIEKSNAEHFEEVSDKVRRCSLVPAHGSIVCVLQQIVHCAYRVGYMSTKQLVLRLNTIAK